MRFLYTEPTDLFMLSWCIAIAASFVTLWTLRDPKVKRPWTLMDKLLLIGALQAPLVSAVLATLKALGYNV